MRNWPPEKDHTGGNYGPQVHRQALPTVVEVNYDPEVRRLMPVVERVMKKPAMRKKPAVRKKPAAVKRVVAVGTKTNPAKKVVKKKPAAAKKRVLEVTKPGKEVRKKPASSRVR